MSIIKNLLTSENLDKAAIICGNKTISYAEFLKHIKSIADMLVAEKKKSSHNDSAKLSIGILLHNDIEFLEIFFGAACSGNISLIYHPEWTHDQMINIINQTVPDFLFIDEVILNNLAGKIKCERIVSISSVDKYSSYYKEWINLQPNNTYANYNQLQDKDVLFINFTSGTTAMPKGFVRGHQAWIDSFKASNAEFKMNTYNYVIAPGPLAHGFSFYPIIEALTLGLTVVICKKFDANYLQKILAELPNSCLFAIPTMLRKLINDQLESLTLPLVKAIITASEKLEEKTADHVMQVFPNISFYEYYGASELGFVSIRDIKDKSLSANSVGRSFQGVEIEIRHENGERAQKNDTGFIWIKSPYLMRGYIDNKTLTSFRYINGWATVGDIGYIDNNNYLYIISRIDDMIITGGFNVYPQEVEAELLKNIPHLNAVVVFSLPDDTFGNIICAALITNNPHIFSKSQLKNICRQILPYYKCPKKYYVAKQLPLTFNGKVSRSHIKNLITTDNSVFLELNS